MFSEAKARRVTGFIECLKHTKGEFHGKPFRLLPWQERIVRDVFGTVREDDPTMRQYTTAYIEIPKKQGKSELGAAIALNMLVNDDEWKAEVYSCASDRQQAAIVFDVAVDMVKQSPALSKRIKIIPSMKRMVYQPTGSIYDVLIYKVSTQRDPLRLRSGTGTKYKILGKYKKGTEIIVLDKTTSSWYEVTCPDGKHGYMSTDYLTYVRTETQSTQTNVGFRNEVMASGVTFCSA